MRTIQWLGIVILMLAAGVTVQAQTYTWSGEHETNPNWGAATNWVGNTVPAFGGETDLIWNTPGAGQLTSYLGAVDERVIRSITFDNNVTNAVQITLQRSSTITGAGNLKFEADSGSAGLTVDSGATAPVTITGPNNMILGSALNVTHNGSGLLTLGSVITGDNGITFAGTGTTLLDAVNTFTGDVNLNGGTVQFELQNRFGDNNNELIFDGGTIEFIGTANRTIVAARKVTINDGGATIHIDSEYQLNIVGEVHGTGALTVTGPGDGDGRLRFSNTQNADNWTGDLNIIDGGQVNFADRNELGSSTVARTLTLDDGTLQLLGAETENLSRFTTFDIGGDGGTLSVANAGGVINLRGNITGNGLLTVDGQGTVFMLSEGGPNEEKEWDGGINIVGGTVRIDEDIHATNAGALGTGSITLDGGALQLAGGNNRTIAREVTIGSEGGTFRADSARLSLSAYTGSGDVTITGGGDVLAGQTDTDFSGAWNIVDGGTLTASTTGGSDTRLGSGDVNMDDGTLTFLLSGSDVHTRDTVLGEGGGTIRLGNAAAQNPTITWNGDISGEGALTVDTHTAGILRLGGKNTFSGDTVINEGATMNLIAGGELMFTIGLNGENNQITGDGTLNLRGMFKFDLTGANESVGNSWIIVDGTGLDVAFFDGQFAIDGFNQDGTVWTNEIDGSSWYEFDQTTGVLEVKGSTVPTPDIDSIGVVLDHDDVVVTVAFEESPGAVQYVLKFSADLVEGIWTPVATNAAHEPLIYTNDMAQGFFRIKAE